MFSVIGFIVFGLIVGIIARAIMPGRDNMSLPVTAILGVIGAVLAGWLGRALGWYGPEDGAGYLMSIVGAMILLGIYNYAIRGKRRGVTSARSDRDFPRRAA